MLQNVQKKRSKVGLLHGLQQELECLRWYFAAAIMQQVTVNPGNRVSGRISRESVESEGTLVHGTRYSASGLREQHSMSVEGEAQEWCSGGWCSATKMGGCFSQSFPEERWKYQRQAANTRLCNSWSLVGFKQQQPCQVQDKILIWELQVNFVRYLTYMHQIK